MINEVKETYTIGPDYIINKTDQGDQVRMYKGFRKNPGGSTPILIKISQTEDAKKTLINEMNFFLYAQNPDKQLADENMDPNLNANLNQAFNEVFHQHFCRLSKYLEKEPLYSHNGPEKEDFATFLILEFPRNGYFLSDLFLHPANQNLRCPDGIARFYFMQFLRILEAIHPAFCLRRISFKSLIVSEENNVKLTDLGSAYERKNAQFVGITSIPEGMKEIAPELQSLGQPYDGNILDLYMVARIIFYMTHGKRPYNQKAKHTDPFYRQMIDSQSNFWKDTPISHSLKLILIGILSSSQLTRPSLTEIRQCLIQGPELTATPEEVRIEMTKRRDMLIQFQQAQIKMAFDNFPRVNSLGNPILNRLSRRETNTLKNIDDYIGCKWDQEMKEQIKGISITETDLDKWPNEGRSFNVHFSYLDLENLLKAACIASGHLMEFSNINTVNLQKRQVEVSFFCGNEHMVITMSVFFYNDLISVLEFYLAMGSMVTFYELVDMLKANIRDSEAFLIGGDLSAKSSSE